MCNLAKLQFFSQLLINVGFWVQKFFRALFLAVCDSCQKQ